MRNDFKPNAARIQQEAILAGMAARNAKHCTCGGTLKSWHNGAPVGPERRLVWLCTVCGAATPAPELEAMIARVSQAGGIVEVARVGGLV